MISSQETWPPLDPTPEPREAPLEELRLADCQALTDSWDSANLLNFHNTDGRPLRAPIPSAQLKDLSWNATYKILHLLGRGAQGWVYLADRKGFDGYFTKVAVKIFYRRPDLAEEEYVEEMRRIALQAQRVSGIQHDNLVAVRDFVAIDGTRVMVLEWVDGVDLRHLLSLRLLNSLKKKLDKESWEHLNDVIVTAGEDHCRLKPGIAVDILHGCLAGLSALHKTEIAHCDLKPSNIMVKKSGTKKIIDIDSSCVLSEGQDLLRGTPYYMAPEQILRQPIQLESDIASLGYILIEMITGRLLFRDCRNLDELLKAKLKLPLCLDKFLPADVKKSDVLRGMLHKMVALNPNERFQDADAVDLDGAMKLHRQLIEGNLATDFTRELAWWIERIGDGPILLEQEALEKEKTQPV